MFGDYAERIKNWRKENKLSLKEAAMVIEVSEKILGWWEKGVRYPDRVKYEKLSIAMQDSKK